MVRFDLSRSACGRTSSGCGFGAEAKTNAARPARVVPMACARGFTIVELMVTLAVATILIAIAVPSFRSITLSNRLTTTANDMVDAINTARLEAIKRNGDAQVCSNSASLNGTDALGTACGSQTGAVYLAETPTSATTVSAPVGGITTPLKLDGNVTALRFSAQGLGYAVGASGPPYSGTVADICTPDLSSNNHRIIKITTGSAVATTSSTGACP